MKDIDVMMDTGFPLVKEIRERSEILSDLCKTLKRLRDCIRKARIMNISLILRGERSRKMSKSLQLLEILIRSGCGVYVLVLPVI